RALSGSLSVAVTAEAVSATPGVTYLGRESYTEYHPGTLPLVLTAPHGGSLTPAEIPDRSWGTTVRDRNTRELTLAVREALFTRTGAYPHVIFSNLHRTKLDPNREIVEAAQGDPEAERAWWEFQVFAEEAGNLVEGTFGEGLHLDIHEHSHGIDRLELGYLLSRTDLSQPDGLLSGTETVNRSSVKALAEKPGNDLAGLVRGPLSLGTLLEERRVPAIPSTSQPDPGLEDYFTGGYITERHGSRDGGNVSAIQIEHHYPGLRDQEENRRLYAEALADALLAYFPAHFGFVLGPPAAAALHSWSK
ncbi:MAG: N-formylglutamate amidohydrolase, partial [Longimicrobiales bacterium]